MMFRLFWLSGLVIFLLPLSLTANQRIHEQHKIQTN